jgi:hypothetical protein
MLQPKKFLYPAHVCPPFLLPHLPFLLIGAGGLADGVGTELGRTTVAIVDDAAGAGVGATGVDVGATGVGVGATTTDERTATPHLPKRGLQDGPQ